MDKVKDDIAHFIDRHASALLEVSHAIHANPELAFKEYEASALLTRTLEHHKPVSYTHLTLPTKA